MNKPREYFPENIKDLPERPDLPDLFQFFGSDRRVNTPEDWKDRREEIRDLLMYYLYGNIITPPESASKFRALTEEEKEARTVEFSWPGMEKPFRIRPEAAIEITDRGKTVEMTLDAFRVPVQGVDTRYAPPYPALICVGGISGEQADVLISEGYAYIAMNTGSVYSDGNNHQGAYNELYPYQKGVYEYDSGTLLGWGWGVSRIVDALKNDPSLNVAWDKCAVTGCSRNGKAAAIAAAFDDRIAVSAPSDPGGGGLTGFRYSSEGQLHVYKYPPKGSEGIYSRNEFTHRAMANASELEWFTSKARELLHENAVRTPTDAHALAALIAPRPLICHTGEQQQAWLNSPSTVLHVNTAKEVYEFLGAGGNVAAVVRDGPHANQDRDLPDIIAILDVVSGRRDKIEVREWDKLKKDDGTAKDNSGPFRETGVYPDIASLAKNPYALENSFLRWARPGKHTLWTDKKFVAAGVAQRVTIYTDAPKVTIMVGDIEATVPAEDGSAEITIEADEEGVIVIKTAGPLDENSVTLVVLSIEDALGFGLNLSGGSPDGMAVGFSSPIVNLPDVSINGGEKLAMSYQDDGSAPIYLERFGVSLKSYAIPDLDAFTLNVRNVKLEALPDRVINIEVPLKKGKVKNWMGMEVDALTSGWEETPRVMTEENYTLI